MQHPLPDLLAEYTDERRWCNIYLAKDHPVSYRSPLAKSRGYAVALSLMIDLRYPNVIPS